jgi:Spy/CpxP family protein refolding chaperone
MAFLTTKFVPALATLTLTLFSGLLLSPSMAQLKPSTPPGTTKESGAKDLVTQLKLTDKQKKEIAGIRRSRTMAINKILTPDQKTKFEDARKAGKSTSDAMKELNLKPDQKKQILEAMRKSADSIKGVLNPDQQKQLVTYLKNRQTGLE